jgi:pyruvate carboxylase
MAIEITTPTLMAANRGEIAIRIIRAGKELNLKTISIFSYEGE